MGNKPVKWDQRPEWQRLIAQVKTLEDGGMAFEEIKALIKADHHAVKRILEDEQIADQYCALLFSQKTPTIESIIGLSLRSINLTLIDLAKDDKLRKEMLGSVRALQTLTAIVKDLTILNRLELGKSTNNVEQKVSHTHTYEQTRVAIQDLSKKDPVFSYPELPTPPSEKLDD